jgi:hypothetical protein
VTTYATPLKDQKSGENKLRPFEFGIVVGPDKSQVHGTTADQTGYNLGLTFGFNLSKRWQINTGLVYNKKYYNANGEDYHAPKGYWTDTLYLSMVNGRCYMWIFLSMLDTISWRRRIIQSLRALVYQPTS